MMFELLGRDPSENFFKGLTLSCIHHLSGADLVMSEGVTYGVLTGFILQRADTALYSLSIS